MADLWWLMLALGIVVFLVFVGLLVWAFLRRADESSMDEARHERLVHRWVGIGGVAVPAVIIIVVFGATLLAMRDVPQDAPDGALHVEITGNQFWYEVRYPDTGLVTANELHLPTGRPIALELRSTDVIHSFWVPALGGKLDMLPGNVNTLVLQADEPGEHVARCAEFCGLQHTKMSLVVVAEPPDAFSAWMDEQLALGAPQGEMAERGREVFVGADCASCHAMRGEDGAGTRAPDLTTLPTRSKLAAGAVANTTENLATFIRDPDAIKEGIEMPGADLSDADLEALLAYLGMAR